jgi:hypothetical protein
LARVDRAANRASGHAAWECSARMYIGTMSSEAKRRWGREGTGR